MLFTIWVVFHVLTCIALVLVVLMQSAKGEGLAGGTAFGGGVSNAVFGGRGAASFLSRATTVLAVLFMVNCGALAFMSSGNRPTLGTSGDIENVESAVTRQAQAEREAALERQAAQAEAEDTQGAGGNQAPVRIVPVDESGQPATEQPAAETPDGSGN
ncbi:MAG: preprotein translocase subunit SecG [bacterium]|nr:preprotein translocase subunit SecG [bacterium]